MREMTNLECQVNTPAGNRNTPQLPTPVEELPFPGWPMNMSVGHFLDY